MPKSLEMHHNDITISTDPLQLDVELIIDFLSPAYRVEGRTHEKLELALENPLVFGVYDGARVVSDYAIFAYLPDMFIHEDYRGLSIGKWMMATV